MKDNNISIPQKKYDETTGEWVDGGEPIESPKSAYTITEVLNPTKDNYSFIYKSLDENENVVDKYYKITLKPKTISPTIDTLNSDNDELKSAYTIKPSDSKDYSFKINDDYFKIELKTLTPDIKKRMDCCRHKWY